MKEIIQQLIQQIESNDFKDSDGHDIKYLAPYVELKMQVQEQASDNELSKAAEELISETLKENQKPQWELKQIEIQDFSNQNGNKFTLAVVVKRYDTRSRSIEE